MKTPRRRWVCSFALLTLLFINSARSAEALPEGFQKLEIEVGGVKREGLVYAPASAKAKAAPLVFVWHGHGGTGRGAVRSFGMNQHWPEAISVYMSGLNTPGRLTDPEGKKPGWQGRVGDQGDRDLKLFDAVLAKLKQDFKVDPKRIYSTGHSNGGGFTYLLWAARGDVFAAVAPSAAASARTEKASEMLKPKPAMHLAGEKDPLVKYEWQKLAMAAVRKLNGCEAEGKPWDKQCLIYESKTGTPFVSFIHPGGHEFVKEAPPLIVKFFKQHSQ
ncbi:MAG: prolyl oligopeptidase family serine peptidase [Verrucomicrobia bacterium]|nr:prolyl oligopeptidase family serine peptidase [Verrucomicrobiota bacterium]